ncbi:rab GTPase binding protein upregulated in meiosis II [Schizosaccharomyces japonicus yFS275]|uniref:Rab GTPase binding protein upregulated in meiosis II n=1 Tax=Schizosaccharomyces japonicus (strain yFS275 / FY16936) TaxID=402676 RepID=B6K349_SCHJY|nr:rab GTPase binding protein upregulated in meiosis II [Schizosaccharomyces japonicus yFS275]EEB07906.1 rab GTPase binding protein upregulated in meiosis II [Schizosaccharomyces japonicus yFS275]
MDARTRIREVVGRLSGETVTTRRKLVHVPPMEEHCRLGVLSMPRLKYVAPRIALNFHRFTALYVLISCLVWTYTFFWYPFALLALYVGVLVNTVVALIGPLILQPQFFIQTHHVMFVVTVITFAFMIWLLPFWKFMRSFLYIGFYTGLHAVFTATNNPSGLL